MTKKAKAVIYMRVGNPSQIVTTPGLSDLPTGVETDVNKDNMEKSHDAKK